MVRQWQQAFYGERYSHSRMTEGAPDFQKLAEAFGIKAFTINNRQNMQSALQVAIDYPGPVLLDCQVTENENCYPMVAPGKSNAQMIGIAKPQRGTASNYINNSV